jgi:ribosomal protein S12 methylthiotransferase accessory factor
MILDSFPFSALPENATRRAISSFIALVEKKLGVIVSYDANSILFGRPDLTEATTLASLLEKNGIVVSLKPSIVPPDEPPIKLWSAQCAGRAGSLVGVGGGSSHSDLQAIYATLAEGVERCIWFTQSDYCKKTLHATPDELRRRKIRFVAPERFAGFSATQRESHPRRKLRSDASYFWTSGTSLLTGAPAHLPFQTLSGKGSAEDEASDAEPAIRHRTTIGLATWPTQKGAQLAGALEIIEREAYMVMWLNQLTLPRIALGPVCEESPTLLAFVKKCERYGLKVHAIRMLTDAPTHAICVVLEDESEVEPRFALGLKAHRSLAYAIEKAMTEALRARRAYRNYAASGNRWDSTKPILEIGHVDRLYYWGLPENARNLEFLIAGKEAAHETREWDSDTEEGHLSRILLWCRTSNFECISIPLTSSKKNITPWHIEMVVMPDLQPTYLLERSRSFGCNRWQEVPKKFNISPRSEPYEERPHPYA